MICLCVVHTSCSIMLLYLQSLVTMSVGVGNGLWICFPFVASKEIASTRKGLSHPLHSPTLHKYCIRAFSQAHKRVHKGLVYAFTCE